MQPIAPAASDILDMQARLMQNARLVEDVRGIWEWRKAITVDEDNSNNVNYKITNRFGLVSSATTGEQALAMLMTKEDERMAAIAAIAAKKDQAKDKRAKDITAPRDHRLRDPDKPRATRPFRAAPPKD
jgi:predicted RNA-binding protein with PUA domain